ncbi:MAG: hypothetical protein Ct9H300mP18_09220 [Candidatus Neomarinimicrobiota bacterium]|nr:MAG: hypothetical protein Ct9H300mP18_09220 [Candidatus Neomarinimicrobiota bacterium]
MTMFWGFPGGSFMMGSSDQMAGNDEKPVQKGSIGWILDF